MKKKYGVLGANNIVFYNSSKFKVTSVSVTFIVLEKSVLSIYYVWVSDIYKGMGV